jgi:hypothetical protein
MNDLSDFSLKPYGWALECLNVHQAHRITRSSADIIVAVIDLGYRHHPMMEGHLWEKSIPGIGTVNGYDAFSDDYTLEYDNPQNDYHKGHHVFVAGEIANTAPECKIMIVRVGYGNPDCWSKAVRFAVDNGASVIVMPHGYLNGEREYGKSLFELGGDFAFPYDNTELLEALDYAYDNDCMIFSGTCDNRGRRVAYYTGTDAVIAVGSSNRHHLPADICDSADYVDMAAPGGERKGKPETDHIYGYGGDQNYIFFTGGCMACGFAGGVAALVRARFPQLKNEQIKQIMQNTAYMPQQLPVDEDGKSDLLGYGIVDAYACVSVKEDQLHHHVDVNDAKIVDQTICFTLKNQGVFNSNRTLVTVYNGNPAVPPAAEKGKALPSMTVKQIDHTVVKVRGFQEVQGKIPLKQEQRASDLWLEVYSLDRHSGGYVSRLKIRND